MAEENMTVSEFSQDAMDQLAEAFAVALARNTAYGGRDPRGGGGGGGNASVGSIGTDEYRQASSEEEQIRRQGDDISGPIAGPRIPGMPTSGKRSPTASIPSSALFGRSGKDVFREMVDRGETNISAPDGLLPSFFGGSIGWQQMAQAASALGGQAVTGKGVFGSRFEDDTWLGNQAINVGRIGEWADQNSIGIEAAQQGFRKLRASTSKMEGLGASLGATPGAGFGSSFGPMRLPFVNPAARKGIGATIDSMWSAGLSPGISVSQDLELKQQLQALGYKDGNERTKAFLGESEGGIFGIGEHAASGMRELAQYDPKLANEELADQWTRNTTSIEGFNRAMDDFVITMKGSKEAANAANVSVEQMQADMQALGQYSASTGGTFKQGAAMAPLWSTMTGTPAAVLSQMQQSPMIQSQIYRDTGMMPQMQSALDPMTQIGSTMQGFMESYNNAGRFSNKIIRDENGFVIDRVTGTEQKAAMVAEQYGLDPEMVSRLAGGGNLENWMSGIKSKQLATGGLAMADAANQAAVNGNVRGVKRWNRGMARNVREAEKHMRRAVDDQGNKLYDDEKIDEIMANAGNSAKDITASGDVSGMSDDEAENFGKFLQKQGRAEKGEDESWKDYVANNIDSKNAKLMKGQYTKQRRLEEFRNLTTEKEENREEGGGGNEVIELGPYAKQFFQMVSPGAMNKAAANAGGPATNQGYPSSRQIGPAGGYSN